jgi:hypothetical protein
MRRAILVALALALALPAAAVPAAQAARPPSAGEHAQLVAGAQLYAHLLQQSGPAKGLKGRFTAFKVSTSAPGYGFGGVTFSGPNTTLETLGLLLQRSGTFWGVVDEGCCDSYGCQAATRPIYKDWLGVGLPSICPSPRLRTAAQATISIPKVAPAVRQPATFALTRGGSLVLSDLHWSGWGQPIASATGTFTAGKKGGVPVKVNAVGLAFAGSGHYTYLEWEYAGGARVDGYPKGRYAIWLARAGALPVS